jgi:hypothetical protein
VEEGGGLALLGLTAGGLGVGFVTVLLLAKLDLEGWRPAVALGGWGVSLALLFVAASGFTRRRQRQRVREYDRMHARAREDALRMKDRARDDLPPDRPPAGSPPDPRSARHG